MRDETERLTVGKQTVNLKLNEKPFPEVTWQLIDSVMGIFVRHHLPSPVDVVAANNADLRKMPFY